MDQAIPHLQTVLKIHPGDVEVEYVLGTVFLQKGQLTEAIAYYEKALEIKPDYADAHGKFERALLQKGRVAEAVAHFQKAVQIDPKFADGHRELGGLLLQGGRAEEAIAHYSVALETQPRDIGALNNLAWILATSSQAGLRNGARAVELAEQADGLSGDRNPAILGTLAAAYAEAGRLSEAVAIARRALQSANAQTNNGLAGSLQAQIELYQAGSPFRDTRPANTPPVRNAR